MILVDNFKIILLVGLICTVGISPSDAQAAVVCKGTKADSVAADPACTAATPFCVLSKDGTAKCADAHALCPTGTPTTELKCDDTGCCCGGASDNTQDNCMDVTEAQKDKICMLKPADYAHCGDGPGEATTAGPGDTNTTETKSAPRCLGPKAVVDCDATKKETVCKTDKDGGKGCATKEDCKLEGVKCDDKMCCCPAAPLIPCNLIAAGSAICKAAGALEIAGCKLTVTPDGMQTTEGPADPNGADGLFENHFGLPLLALVSASMFCLPLKSLL